MQKKTTIYQMTSCAIMAALMCILGPNSIPIGPIPVSLTNLVIYLSVYLLGFKGSLISCAVYLLLGVFGLPVFSGYQGGLAKVVGPTGGYLVGFLFIAVIGGLFLEKAHANVWMTGLGLVIGTAVLYAFGTVWFVVISGSTWAYAMSVCVVPFIAFDLIKIVLASALGVAIRSRLNQAGLLQA